MRYRKLKITLAILVIVLSLGYLAYDSYFQLPVKPAASEDKTSESTQFQKFNILILGLDGRKGVNDRADTIMLASLDGQSNKAQLLSIPRDTRVKIKGAWDKINAAYAYGGLDLTRKTVSEFLDIKIDRYAIVDFNSLVKVVDQVGGIEVDVPVRMYVPLEGIDLQAGKQHLDGEQVLAYSRFRGTIESDIGRAKRQQEVMKLLLEKMLTPEYISKLPQLIATMQAEVKTDLTVKELVALARIAPEVVQQGISSQVLPGKNKKIDGIWYWEPELASVDAFLQSPRTRSVASSAQPLTNPGS